MNTCGIPIMLAALLVGCAGEKGIVDQGEYPLDLCRPAQAAYPRVKVLVIHYTADDLDRSLATLTERNASTHYLVPDMPPVRNGKPVIWQRVPEPELAWPDPARVNFWLGGRRPNQPVDSGELLALLSRYGYDVTPEMTPAQQKRVIEAFQMHFRPARYDGVADAQTQAIAEALLEQYGQG